MYITEFLFLGATCNNEFLQLSENPEERKIQREQNLSLLLLLLMIMLLLLACRIVENQSVVGCVDFF
ncbi:hypothetical protein VNO77_20387 [Canavalia gladiata]|uniref:Uncharacterized protein n=1 Tax=Canavalia gladiata TaxID=3824 RepID=A0AAN9LPH3_CANGL